MKCWQACRLLVSTLLGSIQIVRPSKVLQDLSEECNDMLIEKMNLRNGDEMKATLSKDCLKLFLVSIVSRWSRLHKRSGARVETS